MSKASQPPIDFVLMFKVLILLRYYGLSEHETEYLLAKRTSFHNFQGIENKGDVPNEKTVWKYREELAVSSSYNKLF